MKKSWIWVILFLFVVGTFAESVIKLYQKGKKAYDNGEYREAIHYFKLECEADPQDGNAFNWLGLAYNANGQYLEAVDAFKQSLILPHLTDLDSTTWSLLAQAQQRAGQLDQAISSWKKHIELAPDDYYGFVKLAEIYDTNMQFDEAIAPSKRAIELKPDAPNAYYFLGVAYGKIKRYDEAITTLKKAIEIDPKSIEVYPALGYFFAEQGDYSEAAAAFEKSIEAEPSNLDSQLSCAMAHIVLGKYDEAITAMNTLIPRLSTLPKEAASSFGLRSIAYRHEGNLGAALQDAEKAYSLDPTNEWVLLSLGAAYLDNGKYAESVKLLMQVKDDQWAQLLEATAYAKQGKLKEAENIYLSIPEERISLKKIPLMSDRRTLLQIFEPLIKGRRSNARSLEAKGQYREALSDLSEALKITDGTEAQAIQENIFNIARRIPSLELPEDARECALRAEMLVKESNFEKAVGEYVKAIRIAPYIARLYYNSALVYSELKKYADAIRQMSAYLQAAPDAPDARAAKDEIIKWKFMLEKEGGN